MKRCCFFGYLGIFKYPRVLFKLFELGVVFSSSFSESIAPEELERKLGRCRFSEFLLFLRLFGYLSNLDTVVIRVITGRLYGFRFSVKGVGL